jgi:hypothetical protein
MIYWSFFLNENWQFNTKRYFHWKNTPSRMNDFKFLNLKEFSSWNYFSHSAPLLQRYWVNHNPAINMMKIYWKVETIDFKFDCIIFIVLCWFDTTFRLSIKVIWVKWQILCHEEVRMILIVQSEEAMISGLFLKIGEKWDWVYFIINKQSFWNKEVLMIVNENFIIISESAVI